MTQARYEDAEAGWRIFHDAGGEVSRIGLNQQLTGQGRRTISKRTFEHYEKLRADGRRNYIAINRFDLRRATDNIFDAPTRARYSDHELGSPGRLLIPRRSKVSELSGTITWVSESYATFRTALTQEAVTVVSSSKYRAGILEFVDASIERAIELRDHVDKDGVLEIVVAFRSLLTTELLFPENSGSQSLARMTVPLGENPPFATVLEAIQRSFDVYETARALNDQSSTEGAADPSASPRISRLSVESPLQIEVLGDAEVWELAATILTLVGSTTGAALAIRSDLRDERRVLIEEAEEKRKGEQHNLEMKSMQIDNLIGELDAVDRLHELGIFDESKNEKHQKARLKALLARFLQSSFALSEIAVDEVTVDTAPELATEDE